MKKIAVIYGAAENGVQKKALEVLSRELLDYTVEYPTCIAADQPFDRAQFGQLIYIGTAENNPHFSSLPTHPERPEGYVITVKDGVIYIEGYDDGGVLYGCVDFYAKYIVNTEYTHNSYPYWKNPFENDFVLPDFELASAPSMTNRGLWTWGHVIYDYRNYIDNMVKLKMNCVIIWNDFVPVNINEMIAYAHDSNVKIILGYPWGWDNGIEDFKLSMLLGDIRAKVVEEYKREFAHLNIDGIYFQTVTETGKEELDGVLIAEAVTEFVNRTAADIFEITPSLELQFGLHATSVNKRLEYIKRVDPRVRILWENCGTFPFDYIPKHHIERFDQTLAFVREIAALRGENERFGVVTKAFTKLDWMTFEHQRGAYYMGVSSDAMQENRVVRKYEIWKYLQAYWLTYADKAYEMIRAMWEVTGGEMYCTALVEDGMFEKELMYIVALYGEMLWNTEGSIKDMMTEVALRRDVRFV
ncbi:MAG: hypothetical protein E7637_05035 [Ruminococcaceae bacterium]|nr:hypothetical protein [Oscillospiraceae bacterium]